MGEVSVLDTGAVGLGASDEAWAIQAALSKVGVHGGTVRVPQGTYNVAASLRLTRGTRLILEPGAVLRRSANVTMLINGSSTSTAGGFTGHGDIYVGGGGTLDMRGTTYTTANNCLSFGHCEGVTVENVTIKDVPCYHGIELNGVRSARIRGVRFLGFVDTSGTNANFFRESIQVDLAKDSTTAAVAPYDHQVCEDVEVSGCTFGPSGTAGTTAPPSAMGGHSGTITVRHKGIRFVNNYVDGCSFWAFSGYAMTGVTASGNTLTGCGAGIRADTIDTGDTDDTKNTAGTQTSASQDERGAVISGNTILDTGTVGDAIRVWGEATGKTLGAVVSGNLVDGGGSGTRGINMLYAERAAVTGNTIYNVNGSGIYLDHCDDSVVTGNTSRAVGGTGILVTNSIGFTVGSNQVRSPGGDGIQVTSSTDFTINANSVRLAGTHGIDVLTNCSDFVVSNNVVRGASRDAAGVSAAFRTSATCTRGTWSSNRARKWGSGNEYLNGFSATNTCSNMKRALNTFQDGTVVGSAISDASTSQDLTATDVTAA